MISFAHNPISLQIMLIHWPTLMDFYKPNVLNRDSRKGINDNNRSQSYYPNFELEILNFRIGIPNVPIYGVFFVVPEKKLG